MRSDTRHSVLHLVLGFTIAIIVGTIIILLSFFSKKDKLHRDVTNKVSSIIKNEDALLFKSSSKDLCAEKVNVHLRPTPKDIEYSTWSANKAMNYIDSLWHSNYDDVSSIYGLLIGAGHYPWVLARCHRICEDEYYLSEIYPFSIGQLSSNFTPINVALQEAFKVFTDENNPLYIKKKVEDLALCFNDARNEYFHWEEGLATRFKYTNRITTTGHFCNPYDDKDNWLYFCKFATNSYIVYIAETQPITSIKLFFEAQKFKEDLIKGLVVLYVSLIIVFLFIYVLFIIENDINSRFSSISKKYPLGVSFWCQTQGENKRKVINNIEKIIFYQKIEEQYSVITNNYGKGLSHWRKSAKSNERDEHKAIVAAFDQIKDLDRKIRIHDFHEEMINLQKDFSGLIFHKICQNKIPCIVRECTLEIDSFDGKANSTKVPYPITIYSKIDISKFITNEDKYSQMRLELFHEEQ